MKKFLTLLILPLMFVSFLPITALAETSAGIKPNSFFYFFDTAFEKVGLFLTFSSEKKVQKALEHADERLAEAKESANDNKPKAVEKAMEGYKKEISLATEKSLNFIELENSMHPLDERRYKEFLKFAKTSGEQKMSVTTFRSAFENFYGKITEESQENMKMLSN